MKRLPPLPRGSELAVFALVALACAGLAMFFKAHDLAMAAMALPIFIVAAWMGMRRSGQWESISAEVAPVTAADAEKEELAV